MEGAVDKATKAQRQSETVIGETLAAETLALLPSQTFEEMSRIYRQLKPFKTWHGPAMEESRPVWHAVAPAMWKRAEELALAEMPEPLSAIVAEIGVCPRGDELSPMDAWDAASFLTICRHPHNPELIDKLLKKLPIAIVAKDDIKMASAVFYYLTQGRNVHSDPLADAIYKRFKELKDHEPQAKRPRNALGPR